MMQRFQFAAPKFWLFAIVAVFLVLGSIYSVTVPLFESPDEVWHFAFADHLAKGGGLPVFSAGKSAFLREGGQPPLFYAAVALAILPIDRSDFPSWVRFNASHPAITRGATSDTPNIFIHSAREDPPWTGSVLAIHVARMVSLLFGALTIVGIFVAGQKFTGRNDLALLSAALVAFTPQFVYISASVNNDSLIAATATWVGAIALEFSSANFQVSKQYAVWAGVLLGLGLLSKLSGLILLPLVGIAWLIRWQSQHPNVTLENWLYRLGREPGARSGGLAQSGSGSRNPPFAISARLGTEFGRLILFIGTAVLVSGWWYARNIVLYGDPLGWSVWLSDLGVRTPTPTLWQLLPELPALFRTYWADFGGLQFGDAVYVILAAITVIALVGFIKFQISNFKSPTSNFEHQISNLMFLALWLGIVFAGVLRYMQTTPAAQGRLLFPVLVPIGVLMASGLSAWTRRAWLPGIVTVALLALTLAAPFLLIRPAFAKPVLAQLPTDAQPAQAQFGDCVELIGVRFSTDHVEPGGTLRVTTYWRALPDIPRDQRLLIRLMRPDGSSAGQLDATLGTNLYPTTLWRPGQIIVDSHVVRADRDLPTPVTLHIHLGVGDEVEPLLPVTGPSAWASGDVAEVGQVQVRR
jgi:Dolichyl-phosphate-mannose-protein mannosyltransferase